MKLSKQRLLFFIAFSGSPLRFAAEPASNLNTLRCIGHRCSTLIMLLMAKPLLKWLPVSLKVLASALKVGKPSATDTMSISAGTKVLKVITATQKTQTPLFIVTVIMGVATPFEAFWTPAAQVLWTAGTHGGIVGGMESVWNHLERRCIDQSLCR